MTTYIRVLRHLAVGNATATETAEDLGLSAATVRAVLKIQAKDGRVERRGRSGRGQRYGITSKGREHLAARASS